MRKNSLKLGVFVTAFKMSLGLIAYPLYLHYLSATELSIYFLFISTGIIFELLDFNFAGTLSRYFAYSSNYANKNIANNEIKLYHPIELLRFAKKYYQTLCILSVIIMVCGFSIYLYYFTLMHQVPFLKFGLVWLFYSLSMVLGIYFNYMSPLLIGLGYIDKVNKISFISKLSGFIVQVILIISGFGLITLACSAFISAIVERVLMHVVIKNLCLKLDANQDSVSNFVEIFSEIWKTTYKLGLLTLSWILIARLNSFVIGISIKDVSLLNQYLFTFQVITILMTLAHVPISNNYGDISSIYISDNIAATSLFFKANRQSIWMMVILSICMMAFGGRILNIIGIKHSILPLQYSAILVFTYILEKQLVNHSTMISIRNEVPMFKSYLISGCLISFTIVYFAFLRINNLMLFLLPQLIFQGLYNYWYWVSYNLNKSNINTLVYLKSFVKI